MGKEYAEAVERDGGRCRGCGAAYTQVHHIRFRSQGGGDEADNLVCLCDICHRNAHNLDGFLSADLLQAVLRTNGTVKGFRLSRCCYSCSWGRPDALGRLVCAVWEHEVSADYYCTAYRRNPTTTSSRY